MFVAKVKIAVGVLVVLGGAVGAAVGVGVVRRPSAEIVAAKAVRADAAGHLDDAEAKKRATLDRKRLEEEIEIGRLLVGVRLQEYLAGRIVTEAYFQAVRSLRDAELDASKSKAERVAALETYLSHMKAIEDINKKRFDDGRISRPDYLECKMYRLDAERRLDREKAR